MVKLLPWVKNVNVTMSAQPARPVYAGLLPPGLQKISNIVAVSSCKVDFSTRFSCVSFAPTSNHEIPFCLIRFLISYRCSHFVKILFREVWENRL